MKVRLAVPVQLRWIISAGLCLSLLAAASPLAVAAQTPSGLPAGIALPAKSGVYAIDRADSGSALVRLHPVEVKVNSHTGSNLVRGMVYSGPRSSVEVAGLNSATHLHADSVSFLLQLGEDAVESLREGLAIVRLKQTANGRVVSTASQNIFGGQHRREYDIVPITKTDVGADGWVRLTPVQPLSAGEYGIVFLPKDVKLLPGEVYDFDINFDGAKAEPATMGR